ncbi:glycosyltransferase family 4 protein [Euhalothece natronophila Z-M001]|uniref:Glycosyltransferase family 4 protein n=1 Tax=Euhalothece natronophila Z-M001 TaxID=522448 RepID=A0A5B8NI66_9CHRO|nr:glycosyltransferase family 4 protein [Euhalothece natronophila]QDZ38668.1 glycosyltransferase family 4 protein [Euhalothece natronophila Z-M001]
MRVLLLSRYDDLGASSRVRYLQYLEEFKRQGWEVEISPLFSNTYINALYAGAGRERLWEVMRGYVSRFLVLLRANQFDVLIIQKELFPFLPAWFERILHRMQILYIVDYDDAQFHRYDRHSNTIIRGLFRHKIDTVMLHAELVIAGNPYIAERARTAGARQIEIIPTVVDTERYHPAVSHASSPPIVGWIGTPETSCYLLPLLPVFERLQQEMDVRFVAVGASGEDFAGTSVEAWPWSELTEVSSIQQFDIGIMPLEDSPWERGKCGYKLIQYMACAKPVVASPVGVNMKIVEPGKNGYLAETLEDWEKLLRVLLIDVDARNRMGCVGREKVVEQFSLQSQAQRFINCVERVVNSGLF